ncbi:MAG TPA: hypothetical protein VFV38_14750 [Ktedonobacteraceae bacterium]|nr:hypothetical protein [Ktedonobacteraceae bacterium]
MKLITICSMTVRVTFILALILGLAFWFGWLVPNDAFRGIHMLLGIIFVLGLWGLGLAQGFVLKKGSIGLGLATFIVGLAVIIVGVFQDQWRASINVELMNTIHLVLNILAIGLAEMIAGRSKRLALAQA